MAVLDYPKLGPFTADFLAMLYVTFTGLQALDYKTAAKLAQTIKAACHTDYDHLYGIVSSFLASYIPPSAMARQVAEADEPSSAFSLP